jgi:Secretin and TonB N terminus short domain
MLLPALLALLAGAPVPPAPPVPPSPPAPPARTARAQRPPASRLPAEAEEKLQGDWPAQPSGRKVTLEGKMTLDDALGRIARAAGWNLAANTGRAGDRPIVLGMKDVGVEEALGAVLQGTSLAAMRRGSAVTVAPASEPPAAETPVLSGFDRPSGKKFSGEFEDETVDEALKKVAAAAGLSVVLPSGLRGTVTAHFKDAPVEDVLRVILSQAGLTARLEGSIVTVSRAGGSRVVILPKGRVTIPGPGDVDIDVEREVARAMDEAKQAMKDAGRTMKEAGKGAKGRRGRKDKVVSGDQVIGAGEKVQEVVTLRGDALLQAGSEAEQVTAVLGSVDIGPGAAVARDVVAILGDIHVRAGARIGGDAVSIGGGIVIDEGGEVEGQQVSVDVPGIASLFTGLGPLKKVSRPNPLLRAVSILAEFAVLFVLGLLFLTLAPRRLDAVSGALSHQPLKTVLTGLLATVAMPVLAVLLVATVIGIPLVAVQVLGIVVAGVLGFSALALFAGRRVALKLDRGGEVLRLAMGTALMVVVGQIPILGTMAWITAWLLVFGAVVRTRFGQTPPAVLDTTPAAPPPPPPPASGASAGAV